MGRLSKAFDPSTWRGKRDIALFALLAVEGLRCAEVAGLNIESIREG
jgi:integrase